jgi:hypothetical protein
MFVIDGNGLGPLSGKFVWFSLVKTDATKITPTSYGHTSRARARNL